MSEENAKYEHLLKKCYMGIDPSTVSTGYAVVDDECNLLIYGTINPSDKLDQHDKIKQQFETLESLIEIYKPTGICSEEQFGGLNTDTLKKLCQVTGIIMLLASQSGADFTMKYPASWRKNFHGNGAVKKSDTIELVNKRFGINLAKKDNDIADAIGMAVVAYQIGKLKEEAI